MINFSITTPERTLLTESVDSVTLPTELGDITVLPNHIPLVANLVPGEVHYVMGNKTEFFAVSGGFIEIKKGNHVVVLADTAEFGHEIDLDRAEQAREDAKDLMKQKYTDDKSYMSAAAMLAKHLVRVRVANKHRTRKQTLS